MATRVKIALHYHIISDSLPVQAPCKTPWIKAIRIEVDSLAPKCHHERIGNIFSQNKGVPHGYKMRLVTKISHLTDNKVCHKAEQLQALQTCFLDKSDTWLLCVTPHPKWQALHNSNTLKVLVAQPSANSYRRSLVLCCQPTDTFGQIWCEVLTPNTEQKWTQSFLIWWGIYQASIWDQWNCKGPGNLPQVPLLLQCLPGPHQPNQYHIRSTCSKIPGGIRQFFWLKFIMAFDFISISSKFSFTHSDPTTHNMTAFPFSSNHKLYW